MKGDDDITRGVYRTMRSQCRDIVVGGHIFEMGHHWGEGKGDGEERGGMRSVHKQTGTGVDGITPHAKEGFQVS